MRGPSRGFPNVEQPRNALCAAMVAGPGDYPWSSFACNGLGKSDRLLRPHPAYLALDPDPARRRMAYRDLVLADTDPVELDSIRLYLQRRHAWGSDRFRAAIEAQLSRRAGPARIGRPRKTPAESESTT